MPSPLQELRTRAEKLREIHACIFVSQDLAVDAAAAKNRRKAEEPAKNTTPKTRRRPVEAPQLRQDILEGLQKVSGKVCVRNLATKRSSDTPRLAYGLL